MMFDAAHECFGRYTQEVLAWRLGRTETSSGAPEDAEQARRTADRVARMHVAGRRSWLLLSGLGDGTLARMLCERVSGEIVILETDMGLVRRVWPGLEEACGAQTPALLADTSPWALFLLARTAGMEAENCTLCRNPASASTQLRTWQRLFLESRMERTVPQTAPPPLSAACMLHPEEPDLEDFFSRLPPWLHEVCVLWDGTVPAAAYPCPAPLRQSCRPLGAHFGEQRNAMLDMCRTEWLLYLDADERLSPRSWDLLRRAPAVPGLGAVLFPRLTFEGDEEHVRMGYGLWPDVQLRLLRKNAALRFRGAVHESVEGIQGRLALAADMPLLHYSHVRKDSGSLQRRLELFNRAAGEDMHRLSGSYPRLPLEFFHHMDEAGGGLIMLPPM
jgi:hypothetical protein